MEESTKIKIVCSRCTAKYTVSIEHAGKRGKCKNCGQVIEVPFLKEDEDSILSELQDTRNENQAKEEIITSIEFAGFWRRFAAWFIDYMILFLVTSIVAFLIGFLYSDVLRDYSGQELFGFGQIFGITAYWIYFAVMESSSFGATYGKRALRLVVLDIQGNSISFGRASARHFAKLISALTLGFGCIMAGFTSRKQALHDMIANCLVVYQDDKKMSAQERRLAIKHLTEPGLKRESTHQNVNKNIALTITALLLHMLFAQKNYMISYLFNTQLSIPNLLSQDFIQAVVRTLAYSSAGIVFSFVIYPLVHFSRRNRKNVWGNINITLFIGAGLRLLSYGMP